MNDSERKSGLSKKQFDTVLALLTSSSIEKASKKAGVSKTSIYAWLRQDEFLAELRKQREKVFNHCVTYLIGSSEKAVLALAQLLDSSNEALKRLAAKDILELSLKALETDGIQHRLEELEGRVEKYESHKRKN